MPKPPIRIAINGFGRIGRTLFRLLAENPEIQVVAVNDKASLNTLAHLLKYDSIHGKFPHQIKVVQNGIVVNEQLTKFTSHNTLENLQWDYADFVVEATGQYKSYAALNTHLQAGAKRVVLSVPPIEDTIKTVVMGVNQNIVLASDKIISNASCTTNNAAPMLHVLKTLTNIEQAYITTVHSYTTDQSLHDQPHRDLRRARAAAQSIVPTTTGAAKALTKIFPELANVIGGCGIRVPVPNGSLTDITVNTSKLLSINTINTAFKSAANNALKGILDYTEDPIVSIDIINNTHSCVFDAGMTSVVGNMVKIIGWYDNETGYAARLIDLINYWNSL